MSVAILEEEAPNDDNADNTSRSTFLEYVWPFFIKNNLEHRILN